MSKEHHSDNIIGGSNNDAVNPNFAKDLKESGWKLVCDEDRVRRSIIRISHEILERNSGISNLAIVGIRTRGELLANRICKYIESFEGVAPAQGVVDITLYRDDLRNSSDTPKLLETDLPFNVDNHRIVLIDDVLFTGRTVRAALDAIVDFGRPKKVQLAVLCDRGHREVPIEARYVGKQIVTSRKESVRVCMSERDGADGVFVGRFDVKKSKNKASK
jgi:pyrimidine operon attenuation protein/uracil phosphoribosyltransferase